MTSVIGIDLSLTATGLANHNGTVTVLHTKCTGWERVQTIDSIIRDAIAESPPPALVVIEGYSLHSKGSHHFASAELGGIIRYGFWANEIAYIDVPPATLKKYATGKGNANKTEVLRAAWKRLGYDGTDDNAADALWLRAIGMDLSEGFGPVPAGQRAAIDRLRTIEIVS